MITLAITTCKRLELFKQTYHFFQKNVLDTNLISDIMIMDNCSTIQDRIEMQRHIPESIFLSFDEPGYHHVMTQLYQIIETPYFFLLQDDWKCFRQGSWLSKCVEIINEGNVESVCVRTLNYPTDFKTTSNGHIYTVHQRNKESRYRLKRWPGFSFNPSMWKTESFKNIDYPQDKKRHEWKFANRCKKAGLNVAYIDQSVFAHLGEISAYDLNGINRKE